MISKASSGYVSTSPQKTRLVADLIRGQQVDAALSTLKFCQKHVARDVEKVLRSAIANATSKNPGLDVDTLKVARVWVDGASLAFRKRLLPTTMGRAFRTQRRQSFINIHLSTGEEG